jgi:putative hydrolase of the HAD superfamily
MAKITALFWDVGGVLLSNAWDHTERNHAVAEFHLDEAEFNDRHQMVVSSFERGKITLDEYLDRIIFYRQREFSRQAIKDFMYSSSQPKPDVIAIARGLAKSGRYLMSTLNNESKELNAYRIQTFGLREIFSMFISSCFVGLRKPEAGIYQIALDIAQRTPQECCFIDDRPLNLESASQLGMQVIQLQSAEQLSAEFQKVGVVV